MRLLRAPEGNEHHEGMNDDDDKRYPSHDIAQMEKPIQVCPNFTVLSSLLHKRVFTSETRSPSTPLHCPAPSSG